jgi:hypothetical protein
VYVDQFIRAPGTSVDALYRIRLGDLLMTMM